MASRAERATLWQCAKTFLHPIARFAAYLIIKIPPMELNDLQTCEQNGKAEIFFRVSSSIVYQL
jgi:hypothetical protein